MEEKKIIIDGKEVAYNIVDVTSIQSQLVKKEPTDMDRCIADKLGLGHFESYFWPDTDIPEIGHRIILNDPKTAVIYVVLKKREAAH